MSDTEWQVYRSSRQRNHHKQERQPALAASAKSNNLFYFNEMYPDCELDELANKFHRHQRHLKSDPNSFFPHLLSQVREALEILSTLENSKSEIFSETYCLGIGNPANSVDSLSQLAGWHLLLQELHIDLRNSRIYEPLFRQCAIHFIQHKLGLDIIQNNEEALHAISEESFTLVFFPHCHKGLVNNFLFTNWTPQRLSKLVLITDRLPDGQVVESIHVRERDAFSYLYRWRGVSRSWCLPEGAPSGWNGLAVQCLDQSALELVCLDSDFWRRGLQRPCYDGLSELGDFVRCCNSLNSVAN